MSSSGLNGKVALITGGTKGIGLAVAQRLAKDGALVAVNYGSDKKAADEVVHHIGADRCIAIQADAGSVAGVAKIVEETVKKYGRIDILIANAGVLPMKTLESTTEEDFDKTFALNVKGPYFLIQKAVPHMKEGSHVVTISSSLCHSTAVTPPYLLYNSTKGAIEQMTRVLAKDLGSKKILVNCVAPGPTATELFMRGKSEQIISMIANQSPMQRLGQPDEIADVIAFVSSDQNRWMSGQLCMVNGAAFPS
ncbi:NAD(P)-binding protein [Rhizodiscina lignyota]|uniref:NAD(P)-binding protein n=1 Tax=Rhizodiscina lignyota TaxID=1504668 RepID=A0A9P4IKK5_9PEZI|nr:NAD(P)-binding protein [Rhizodiscina lignyota]